MKNENMRKKNHIAVLGVTTIILWVSYIHYLIPMPFGSSETTVALEDIVLKANQQFWFKALFFNILGISAGILITLHKNFGRMLAIGISSLLLISRIWFTVRSENIFQSLYFLYVIFFKEHPFLVIQNDIIAVGIFVITIIYLTRPSVIKEFS